MRSSTSATAGRGASWNIRLVKVIVTDKIFGAAFH
jgi:hypothetical protein